MKKYKVSVCVPVYNAREFIRETLESLVNQTLKDIEIICVNDGSTDDSLKILEEYQSRYKNIKIISQENQGLGGARNTGIKNATGEYIGFIDADDIADKEMYEKLYNLAKIDDSDIAMCNLKFYPQNVKTSKKIWFNEYKGKINGIFLNKNTQPWNKIVKKELIDKLDFSFYEKNGDGMYVLLMIMADKISSTNEELYNYRVGHSSMSTNYKLENFIISVNSAHEQINGLKKTQKYEEFKEYFEYRLIYTLIQGMTIAALKNNKKYFKKYKKELKDLKYKKNIYCKKILSKEYSFIKYFAMMYILPINYNLSSLLTKIMFGK